MNSDGKQEKKEGNEIINLDFDEEEGELMMKPARTTD